MNWYQKLSAKEKRAVSIKSAKYAQQHRINIKECDVDFYLKNFKVDLKAGKVLGRSVFETQDGYLFVSVKHATFYVHRIIWILKHKQLIPVGQEINHKDGLRQNNNWKNLEAITHRENLIHGYKRRGKCKI